MAKLLKNKTHAKEMLAIHEGGPTGSIHMMDAMAAAAAVRPFGGTSQPGQQLATKAVTLANTARRHKADVHTMHHSSPSTVSINASTKTEMSAL